MRNKTLVFLVAALASAAVGGQTTSVAAPEPAPDASRPSTAHATAEPGTAVEPARSPEDEARRAKLLARVGSRTLTVGAFEDQLSSQRIPIPVRAAYADPEKVRRQFEERVEQMAIAAWAERQGIDRRADTRREVRKLCRGVVLYRLLQETLTDESVSDADVAAFYQEHWDWYNRPETVKAGLILLPDRSQAEAALQRALEAKGNRAGLLRLVRELSTDAESKRSGGAVGIFDRDGKLNRPQGRDQTPSPPVDPALVAAAFTLTTPYDVYSQVVETARGPAVVFLFNRTPADSRSIDEVAGRIRPELLKQRRDAAAETAVADARARYDVAVNEGNFEHVVIAAAPPEASSPHGMHGDMLGGLPGMPPMGPPRVIPPPP